MKNKTHIYIVLSLVIGFSNIYAQTFEADGINYYITGSNEVSVNQKDACYAGDIVIPDSVEDSGTNYSVTGINVNAFYQCSGLTSVILPSSVKEINSQAFLECTNLNSINFTSSIETIGYMAFRSCTSLLTIDLSATVLTEIGEYAFLRCENATSIILPNTLEEIADNVFHYCESLTQIVIPNSVESIGTRSFAYSGLTSIDIPSSVTLIDSYAFEVCRDLKTVSVPSSVTSIGDYAFYGNYTLETFNIDVDVPLTITTSVFQGRDLSLVTLNVPAGRESVYASSSIWQNFGNINETLSNNYSEKDLKMRLYQNPTTHSISISGLKESVNYSIYNVVGKLVANGTISNNIQINIETFTEGLYIIKLENGHAFKFIKN